jgi:hypothetical protein
VGDPEEVKSVPGAWSVRQAVDYVALQSAGSPVDSSLQVTANFHPDRLIAGLPILEALGRDGVYRSSSRRAPATAG